MLCSVFCCLFYFVLQAEVFDDGICHRPGRRGGQGARGGGRAFSVSVCGCVIYVFILLMCF